MIRAVIVVAVLVLGAGIVRGEDSVESLSDYRPCCGRCAYLRGCHDDPRDRGACCDPPEHGVPGDERRERDDD